MMKPMRVFLILILGLMCSAGRGLAQEDNFTTATSALQDVLSSLKQSVEKLSVDNNQLSSQDNLVKTQVLELQMQLGQLQAQGDALGKTAEKLQDKNTGRAQQITRLEEENFELDNRTQKDDVAIKSIQQSLDAAYPEEQKLLAQLKNRQDGPLYNGPGPLSSWDQVSSGSEIASRRQKEKLKLMKMIYDSQERQEALHESILEFQKNTPLLPAAGALAHQQQLKDQIKDLEAQIAAYSSNGPGPLSSRDQVRSVSQWDNAQLGELELELKGLEKNYMQLKDLMEQMSKRAQKAQMTVNQHIEGEKLQGNIDDLKRQSVKLIADLDDLRSQMVDLDKRKSHLEAMIQQMP